MANKQVLCEMCYKEETVRCCNICGNICESCCVIHKKGRAFQNHILKMYGKDGNNSKSIVYDITEEMCKHHPTERALLFCKIHELMICGRCFRSDHLSCGHEVVDLCLEAKHIDYDQFNAMSAALNDIKDESKRMKEEVDRNKERSNSQTVKCCKELDDLETKLSRKVNDSISSFKEEVQTLHDGNIAAISCISSTCEENVSWAIQEESQLNEFVNNSLTGRLYLMSRKFDNGISKAKRQMKEAEYKNTFNNVCLKENTAALKCLIEDLTDVCELQEEVDGSDEGTTFSIGNATIENQKTRKDLNEELIQAKLDKAKAEMTKQELYEEMNQVKQDLDEARNEFKEQLLQAKRDVENSKKTLKGLEQELHNAQQNMEKSEKTSEELSDELLQMKQKLDHSEKTRKGFQQDLQKAKQDIENSEMIKKGLEHRLLQVQQGLDYSEKARKGFEQDLRKAKQDIDKSEKTGEKLCYEMQQVKQKLDHSEKTRVQLCDELQVVKQKLDHSEKTRQELCVELKEVKQDRDNSEKTRKGFQQDLQKAKQDIENSEMIKKGFEHRLLQVQQGLDYSEKTRKGFEQDLRKAKQDIDKSEKTREKLCDELQQVKQKLDHSEKTREELCDELQQVKQKLDHSEKTRKGFQQDLQKAKHDIEKSEMIKTGTEQELLQVKQGWDNSEKTRKELEQNLQKVKQDIEKSEKEIVIFYDELQQVKQELDHSEKTKKGLEQDLQHANHDIEKTKKECTTLQTKCTHLKECIKWTQPIGSVEVKIYRERRFPIECVFTFPAGIQTKYNRRPGKPYKGSTFTGWLKDDNKGQLVCRMLKAAFRRGLMCTVNDNECVGLDGLSLPPHLSSIFLQHENYDEYIQKVKAELAAKGITETNIDLTEKLEETFTVEGP